MRIDRCQEMGDLLLVDLTHSDAGGFLARTAVSDVRQSVAQLNKRCIRRLTNTFIILLAGTFGTGAPLVVRQGISNLRSHQCLFFGQQTPCHPQHIVIGKTGILDAVVIIATENQR